MVFLLKHRNQNQHHHLQPRPCHNQLKSPGNLNKINVSDSPFAIKRGLITKNFYTHTTDAFKDVREYERGQGTIV